LFQLSSDDDDDIDDEDEDFFKMIFAGAMLGQTYVDMFVKKSYKDVYNKWNGVYVGAIQHSRRMHSQLRMSPEIFSDLHKLLVQSMG
jgi:hypothetical protein